MRRQRRDAGIKKDPNQKPKPCPFCPHFTSNHRFVTRGRTPLEGIIMRCAIPTCRCSSEWKPKCEKPWVADQWESA